MNDAIWSARDLAERVNADLKGDGARSVSAFCAIEDRQPRSLTFLTDPRWIGYLDHEQEQVVVTTDALYQRLLNEGRDTVHKTYIISDDPLRSFLRLGRYMSKEIKTELGIHPTAVISSDVKLGADVSIGPYAVLRSGVVIGDRCTIGDHVSVDADAHILSDTVIHHGVKIGSGVKIGRRCIIYPHATIGYDGFGHRSGPKGFTRLDHLASVVLEDDVEVGSHTCVDRGMIRDTLISRGTKLDNLIQVAHGVRIGSDTVIAAQTGISGSTDIGKDCRIGGQVGFVGHIRVADGSQIQAQSGVASDIDIKDKRWYGTPLMPYTAFLRSFAIFKRLPELLYRLKRLEDQEGKSG